MAEQLNFDANQPINYALGQGWYSMIPDFLRSITEGRAARAATGTSVLDQLGQFLTSPTAGPLGLSATAAYGNPQGIAEATGGKGFDNSGYMSRYDQLLNDMMKYAGGVNATAENAPYTPAPVDPNKAPGMTPESAAASPNMAQDWINAWEAYHPGQTAPTGHFDPNSGRNSPNPGQTPFPRTPQGFEGGGKMEMNDDGSPKVPHAVDEMVNRSGKVHKAMKSLADVIHMDDGKGAGEDTSTPGFEDGGLAALASVAPKDPAEAAAYWQKMQRIGLANDMLQRAGPGTAESILQGLGVRGDKASSVLEPQMYGGGGPAPTPQFRHISQFSPELINKLLGALVENTRTAAPGDYSFEFADGGGVTLAGQRHWIVDDNGYPVAQITEDGQPENVRGTGGGVEVTPLKPDRFEKYTGQAPMESALWGKMLARMEPAAPGAATGQKFMFPDIPGSTVDTSPAKGTNQIPTFGGPSAAPSAGPAYGAGTTPKSLTDLMGQTGQAPGANYNEQYAHLLGGALAGNTTMNEATTALNQGRAPTKLPSAQQWGTMTPSQRSSMTAYLQQMGIIQSPEDLSYYLNQYRPDGLG